MTTSIKPSESKRLSRLRTADTVHQLGHRLTERDTATLWTVAEYGVLTTHQIEALLFKAAHFEEKLVKNSSTKTSPTRCKARLQRLYHHGYLDRREQPSRLSEGRKPYLYFLDEKGRNYLSYHELLGEDELEQLDLKSDLRDTTYPFLEHQLMINTVRIAFSLAAQARGWTISRWVSEKTLKQKQNLDVVEIKSLEGHFSKASIVPDGFFTLQIPAKNPAEKLTEYNFLLEVDRATETGEASSWGRRAWAWKIRAYGAYLTPQADGKSLFEKRYNIDKVRILTITTGERRASNLKAVTESVGGKKRFWFTNLKKLTSENILTEDIWQIAGEIGDYRLIRGD